METKRPWFAVEFTGFPNITDGPSYEDNNVLNPDLVGEDRAKANAALIVKAVNNFDPMLDALERMVEMFGVNVDENSQSNAALYERKEMIQQAQELIKTLENDKV